MHLWPFASECVSNEHCDEGKFCNSNHGTCGKWAKISGKCQIPFYFIDNDHYVGMMIFLSFQNVETKWLTAKAI